MLLLERLNHTARLSEGQRVVARWLVEHRNEVASVTVRHIAERTHTSSATVVRLAKALDYEGFEPMRTELVAEVTYLNEHFVGTDANQPLAAGDDEMTVASKVCSLARETAVDTLSLMDDATLAHATDILEEADAIHVVATSFPLLYAQDFQLKMRRVGRRVEVCTLVGEPLFCEGIVGPDDCAIAISYSGTTPSTLEAVRMYRRCGIPLVAITSLGDNPLRSLADVTISLTTRERLYSKVAGLTSELSIKLVLDTLYSCCFARHLSEYQRLKDDLSSHAEPGRTSDSAILREW